MLGVRIVVSFVVQQGKVPEPIADAMHAHLDNPFVKQVVIVSESPTEELCAALALLNEPLFSIHQVDERPSFSCMIQRASQDLEEASTLLCVMNADMSFATSKSLELALSTMAALETNASNPAAFCLTRYDLNKSSKRITLKNSVGLPNLVSADCWIFSHPPLEGDFYYCPGQMFCDQFLAHDLFQLNYTLFNPCLDVVTVHHEGAHKDRNYYQQLSSQEDNQQALTEHWRDRVAPAGGGYIGLVHAYAKWIKAGYRPSPVRMASDQRRVYLLAAGDEPLDQAFVNDVLQLGGMAEFEIYLLSHNKKELEKWREFVIGKSQDNLFVMAVGSTEEVIRQFLGPNSKERTLFVAGPDPDTLRAQWPMYQEQLDCLVFSKAIQAAQDKNYTLHAQGLPQGVVDTLVAAAKTGIAFKASTGPVDRTWLRTHMLEEI